MPANKKQNIGVLLLNLGGPEKQEDVRPFLLNLFSDREIIRLGPAFLQKFIARMIVRKRAPRSMANYARIGGGSPIRRRTEEQALALANSLNERGQEDNISFLVRPCMRYWHPFAEEVLQEMARAEVSVIVALSLYPHYSIATTGSSLSDLYRTHKRLGLDIPIVEIRSWPDEPSHIACLVARIREGLQHFGQDPVQLLYSAHSLPVDFIKEGDPYVQELERTIAAIEAQTGIRGKLCYQSRSGPVEWLGPSLPETIGKLAGQGCRNLLVMPVSFVSDHVETLYEIDIEYRQMAEEFGMRLISTRALNDDPLFIEGLQIMVINKLT